MTIIEITVIVGCVLIGIFVYYLYLSTLILRIRLDSRGLLFTMGKSLKTKIVPRRKYGRMQKTIPPLKEEKCRFCKLGWSCPIHKK
jgi:hypothetical protein